jgi:hypothetical protein
VLICVLAAYLAFLIVQATHIEIGWSDDGLWYYRSVRSIFSTEGKDDYTWAVDQATMDRAVYGLALHVLSLDDLPCMPPDPTKGPDAPENPRGILPYQAIMPLHLVDIAVHLAGVLALFLSARLILKNEWGALLAVVPIILSPAITYTVVRTGSSSFLGMSLALFLLVWLILDRRYPSWPWGAVVVMGFMGGLCCWAKWNGALAVVAFALWIGFREPRQWAAKAFGMGAIAVGFLWLITPPFWSHWPWQVVADILSRREIVTLRHYAKHPQWPLSHWQVLQSAHAWLAIPAIAFFWFSRRQPWAAIAGLWATTLTIGTLLVIREDPPRYLAPWYLAILWLLPVLLLAPLLAIWNRPPDSSGGSPGNSPPDSK